MTGNAKLADELDRRATQAYNANHVPADPALGTLLRSAAAALRAAELPPGWRVTEYTREDGAHIRPIGVDNWIAKNNSGDVLLRSDGTPEQSWWRVFASPIAAMEAIERNEK